MKKLIIPFFFLLFACSDKEIPALSPLADNAVILALGDSLTFGVGVNKPQSYPVQLANKISQTVINEGHSGELSLSGLRRLPKLLTKYEPALVLLFHGGNDILQSRSSEKLKENLIAMVELIQQSGAEVIIIGIPQKSLSRTPPPLYQEIATLYNLPYEGESMAKIIRKKDLRSDHVHPNQQGYQLIAEAVYQILLASGAISQ